MMQGDMRETLRGLADNSVDSVVTDPPYHLTSIVKRFGSTTAAPAKVGATGAYARASAGFMGQQWDGGDVAFQPETWAEIWRVLKPGGHMVAFSGTRTYHRMVCAIEDAGFEIRDQLAWAFGSGFPKSHNMGEGRGTALKPAWEPICLARKPLEGTVAANIAKWGTGALNIDGCRIEATDAAYAANCSGDRGHADNRSREAGFALGCGRANTLGRWPANFCHDGSDEVLQRFPANAGALAPVHARGADKFRNAYGAFAGNIDEAGSTFRGDSGSAARFFYCAKASKSERGEGNNHPTVKPVALMEWLARMVTPAGGLVLDPFMGSGSTAVAAQREGFRFIGCELSADYIAIARGRLRA